MSSWKATNRVGLLAAKRLTKSVVAVIFGVGSAAWAQSQGQQNSTNETAITTAQTYHTEQCI